MCLEACLIKPRGQYETLCVKCLSKLFDLSNASWTLSGDARHLLERKNMRWWGRDSLGHTEMMTPTQA
ncbi:hypothetical protein H5410_060557 [Solanum commersonii]|uniref:Uncharacterized protein n=1 Tax=Solanum commersonii TaxID=4109 RepID=A0A9J5W5Z6_SOLCO|nr:hypothetical protein H5410_060557 [Solanum commersonii]